MSDTPYVAEIAGEINPLPNVILVHNLEYGEKVVKGIIIPNDDGALSGIKPRWCQVHSCGENIDYVEPGEWVLVSHARWTRGVKVNSSKDNETVVRMIDPEDILLVGDTPPSE